MRPFERFTSIRAKLGATIVIAVAVTLIVVYVLLALTLPGWVPSPTQTRVWRDPGGFIREAWFLLLGVGALAAFIALVFVRLLARGMTQPLRDMARAAQKMARGDYRERVHTTNRDEVGRLAEAFNQMAAELEGLERLRRDLVANVSHELKTPIAAIRAHLENLLEGVEQPNAATLQVMLRQTERLSHLVEQVLDLSRLESGTMPLAPEPVELRSVASDVAAEIALARPDGARVRVEVPGSLVALVDRTRVHQVLYNLLDNAARYTPAGGAVTVTARDGGGAVTIAVEDDGPGIPADKLPLVFERFFRADASRSRSGGGAGLGLAIVRSIVEAHGGRIGIEPRSPHGTRVWFTLPAAGPVPAAEPEHRTAAVGAAKEEL